MKTTIVSLIVAIGLFTSLVSAQLTYYDTGFPPAPGRRNGNSFRPLVSSNRGVRNGYRRAVNGNGNGNNGNGNNGITSDEPADDVAAIQQEPERVVDRLPPTPNGNGNGKKSNGYPNGQRPLAEVKDNGDVPDATPDDVIDETPLVDGITQPEDGGSDVINTDGPGDAVTTDSGDDLVDDSLMARNQKPTNQRPTNGHGDEGDYEGRGSDRLQWLRDAIRGEPGTDYPILSAVPETGFRCGDHPYAGYYGEPEARCQVFHICQMDGRMDSFLCPNGTIFSQKNFVCVWYWQYDCSMTEKDYALNANLFTDHQSSGAISDSGPDSAPITATEEPGEGSVDTETPATDDADATTEPPGDGGTGSDATDGGSDAGTSDDTTSGVTETSLEGGDVDTTDVMDGEAIAPITDEASPLVSEPGDVQAPDDTPEDTSLNGITPAPVKGYGKNGDLTVVSIRGASRGTSRRFGVRQGSRGTRRRTSRTRLTSRSRSLGRNRSSSRSASRRFRSRTSVARRSRVRSQNSIRRVNNSRRRSSNRRSSSRSSSRRSSSRSRSSSRGRRPVRRNLQRQKPGASRNGARNTRFN